MNYEMTLQKYEAFVRSETGTMLTHKLSLAEIEFLALSNALGGEVGELQNIVKKLLVQQVFLKESPLHDQFVLEAGDVLWYLVRLIHCYGYNVEHVMAANIQKLETRRANRHQKEIHGEKASTKN
mgnify:FL=1